MYYSLFLQQGTLGAEKRRNKQMKMKVGLKILFSANLEKIILDWAVFSGFNMSLRPILFDCRKFYRKKHQNIFKMFNLKNIGFSWSWLADTISASKMKSGWGWSLMWTSQLECFASVYIQFLLCLHIPSPVIFGIFLLCCWNHRITQ